MDKLKNQSVYFLMGFVIILLVILLSPYIVVYVTSIPNRLFLIELLNFLDREKIFIVDGLVYSAIFDMMEILAITLIILPLLYFFKIPYPKWFILIFYLLTTKAIWSSRYIIFLPWEWQSLTPRTASTRIAFVMKDILISSLSLILCETIVNDTIRFIDYLREKIRIKCSKR